jgi:hypothetical protein
MRRTSVDEVAFDRYLIHPTEHRRVVLANPAVAAHRGVEPAVALDEHVPAEPLETLHEGGLGDELLVVEVARIQVPRPDPGDELRDVGEAARAHDVGTDRLDVFVEFLAGVDVEADEVELLLQAHEVEWRRVPAGGAPRAEGMRVVVEEGNPHDAAGPHHPGQAVHAVDKVPLAIRDPVRVERDVLHRRAGVKATRRIDFGERLVGAPVALVEGSYGPVLPGQKRLVAGDRGRVVVAGIGVHVKEERHFVVDLRRNEPTLRVDVPGEDGQDRVVPERRLVVELVDRVAERRDRARHLREDRLRPLAIERLELRVGQDPARVAEPGQLRVDLGAGPGHDVEALRLDERQKCVDVLVTGEVETPPFDLVDLPRDVDRDGREAHRLHGFENAVPLVAVQPPVMDCAAV